MGWKPIAEAKPTCLEQFILWNGVRRFVGWLDDDGWHDTSNSDHMDEPESPQPTLFHPWPELPTK